MVTSLNGYFIVHNLFTVRNFNNDILGEKSVYVYLAVLAGVPCPFKITLQCSADKKLGTTAICFVQSKYFAC